MDEVGVGMDGQRGLSQVERVVNTFVAPTATFKDILRSTSWWLPFVLLVVSSVATAFVVDRKVGFDRAFDNQVRMSQSAQERMAELTPAQKAQTVKIQVEVTKYISYGSFAMIAIFLAIYSLILWASFNVGLGASTKFGQVFAVTMYSALPYLLTALLTILALTLGGNAEGYDYKNPVGTNMGYYLPDAAPWLRGLLSSFDVVKLWSLVLQAMGMAIIAKKKIAQSAIVVGIFWLIGVVVTVAGSAFS
ncbi:MAG: YIP1 family protein [Acidobacteriaceae bacterium]